MNQSDFPLILEELERSKDNTTQFSEAWSQGRSAFGGLAAAFAVTGMRKLIPADIPIARSVGVFHCTSATGQSAG
jgi:hypothetical protein